MFNQAVIYLLLSNKNPLENQPIISVSIPKNMLQKDKKRIVAKQPAYIKLRLSIQKQALYKLKLECI